MPFHGCENFQLCSMLPLGRTLPRGAAWAGSSPGASCVAGSAAGATVGAVSANASPSFGSIPMARSPSSVTRATIQVPSSS